MIVYLFKQAFQQKEYEAREVRTYHASSCDGCHKEVPLQIIENHKEGDKILCGVCIEFKNRKKNHIV